MTLPPGLLGITTLFWGWQTDLIPQAGIMAFLLETPSRLPWQWTFSQKELQRVADLGTLLLVIVAGYAFFGQETTHPLDFMIQMIPVVFFPLNSVAATSGQVTVPMSVLFASLRSGSNDPAQPPLPRVHLPYLFFGLCLIAAAAGAQPDSWYYPLAALLLMTGLWPFRCHRLSTFRWLMVALLAAGVGFGIQTSFSRLQSFLEKNYFQWLLHSGNKADPYWANTAIGKIGRLKRSDWILFQVEQSASWFPPLNLRMGVYTFFNGKEWSSYQTQFRSIPESAGMNWTLREALPTRKTTTNKLTLHGFFPNPEDIIPLPAGATSLKNLLAETIRISQYGVVTAKGLPGFATISAAFTSRPVIDAPPEDADLLVRPTEQEAPDQIIREIHLDTLPSSTQQSKALLNFFQEHFRYTLTLGQDDETPTDMRAFLLDKRAGHCEFFASATVLILRRLGIPARYVTGYSVQEYDASKRLFVVRQRHAHSWVSAYMDGTWQELDPTPAGWFDAENLGSSLWQPLLDLWFHTKLRFQKWRSEGQNQEEWMIARLILVLVLTIVIFRRSKIVRRKKRGLLEQSTPVIKNGVVDSPFRRIEQNLTSAGLERASTETLTAWLMRIDHPELLPLLERHYGLRFDPQGLPPEDEKALQHAVDVWLERK